MSNRRFEVLFMTVITIGQKVSQSINKTKNCLGNVTFHAKTYTNGFPLNGLNKRLSNGLRTVYQAVQNGFIERLNGLLSIPNGQANRSNGS